MDSPAERLLRARETTVSLQRRLSREEAAMAMVRRLRSSSAPGPRIAAGLPTRPAGRSPATSRPFVGVAWRTRRQAAAVAAATPSTGKGRGSSGGGSVGPSHLPAMAHKPAVPASPSPPRRMDAIDHPALSSRKPITRYAGQAGAGAGAGAGAVAGAGAGAGGASAGTGARAATDPSPRRLPPRIAQLSMPPALPPAHQRRGQHGAATSASPNTALRGGTPGVTFTAQGVASGRRQTARTSRQSTLSASPGRSRSRSGSRSSGSTSSSSATHSGSSRSTRTSSSSSSPSSSSGSGTGSSSGDERRRRRRRHRRSRSRHRKKRSRSRSRSRHARRHRHGKRRHRRGRSKHKRRHKHRHGSKHRKHGHKRRKHKRQDTGATGRSTLPARLRTAAAAAAATAHYAHKHKSSKSPKKRSRRGGKHGRRRRYLLSTPLDEIEVLSLQQRAEMRWPHDAFGTDKGAQLRRQFAIAATVIQAVARGFLARRTVSVELAMRRQQLKRVTVGITMDLVEELLVVEAIPDLLLEIFTTSETEFAASSPEERAVLSLWQDCSTEVVEEMTTIAVKAQMRHMVDDILVRKRTQDDHPLLMVTDDVVGEVVDEMVREGTTSTMHAMVEAMLFRRHVGMWLDSAVEPFVAEVATQAHMEARTEAICRSVEDEVMQSLVHKAGVEALQEERGRVKQLNRTTQQSQVQDSAKRILQIATLRLLLGSLATRGNDIARRTACNRLLKGMMLRHILGRANQLHHAAKMRHNPFLRTVHHASTQRITTALLVRLMSGPALDYNEARIHEAEMERDAGERQVSLLAAVSGVSKATRQFKMFKRTFTTANLKERTASTRNIFHAVPEVPV